MATELAIQQKQAVEKKGVGFFVRLVPLFMQSFFIWPITRPFFKFFLHFKVEGIEHIKRLPPGIIFVSNHSSEMDPIFMPTALPFLSRWMPMFYVSRPAGKEFYVNSGWRRMFYGGLFFKSLGAYPAYKGKNDYEHSLRHHISILEGNRSLHIFPEGKKTKDDRIQQARGGAAYLAFRTGKPVVPFRIRGNAGGLPMGEMLSRKRNVSLTIGAPINFSEFPPNSEHSLENIQRATNKIVEAINNL